MPLPHGESYSNRETQTVCTTEELALKHIQALCLWARDRNVTGAADLQRVTVYRKEQTQEQKHKQLENSGTNEVRDQRQGTLQAVVIVHNPGP